MRSSAGTTAGRSALDGYAEAMRRRRRSALRCMLALLATVAFAWVAAQTSGEARRVAIGATTASMVAAVVLRPRPDAGRWMRGSAGEVATAGILEKLPSRRWVVFHDLAVPGSRANIDHLVIGPTGVWVLDTKTTRGAVKRGARSLRLGGRRLDVAPVTFEAQVVCDRLATPVHRLIVVHGAAGDLPRRGARCRGVRVVSAGDVVWHLRHRRWWPSLRYCRLRPGEVERLARLAETSFAPAGW